MSKARKQKCFPLNSKEDVKKAVKMINETNIQYKHADAIENRNKMDVKIVSRDEWGAAPAEESKIKIENLDKPVRTVTFSSTYTDTCNNKDECTKVLKALQEKHIKEGIHDIVHNFMIADDGTVYEGRGWKKENFKYIGGEILDRSSVNIAYIGKYREPNKMPNEDMLNAAFNLIRLGVEKGFIHKRFSVSELGFMD